MRSFAVGCILVAVFLAATTFGQQSTGTMNIQVQDSSGAVLPAATVRITHVATNQTRLLPASEAGLVHATFLPLGEYTVTAEAAGFKTKTITGLELRVDQNTTITVVLVPGEVREVVEVTGTSPLLEASTSSIGQVIDTKKIQDLPLNGRNPFALGLLSANTVPMFGQSTNVPFIGGGSRFTANEVSLDGVDNNTAANARSIGRPGINFQPSVDAVQEFKVQTNNFSAQFGQSAGTVMNASIRSGTNQYHGTLFEFLRNDKLDANNFFANSSGAKKGEYRQNQFGGVLGGRIIRNRTFFFVDYQGTRLTTAASSAVSDLPPVSFRSGDFSQYAQPIYDPTARRIGPTGSVISTPFANNQIPASQISKASAAITALLPLPNTGAPNAQSKNFFVQLPQHQLQDQGDLKIDQVISSKNNMFGRISISNQTAPSVGAFGAGQWLGGGANTINNSRNAALSDVHLFSTAVVNELRLGYGRYNPSSVGTGPQGVGFADAQNIALFPFPDRGFPSINFAFAGIQQGSTEFTGFGGSASSLMVENRFQVADDLSITRGSHTLKLGTDIRRTREDTLSGGYGTEYYGSFFSSSSDKPASGAPFADFLMGFPASIDGSQMLAWGKEREIYWGTYFQDDWKVNPRLTLNLGIRYDLYTQPVDANNVGGLFNIATGMFQIPGKNGYSRAVVDGDHDDWAPRVGFAYKFSQKFVMRGGYGIFYGMRDRNPQTTQFSSSPPNTPLFARAPESAAGTVTPAYTINTPIVALPSDPTLSNFSAAAPYANTFRATAWHNAEMPMVHQFNLNFQYEARADWLFEMTLSGSRGRDLCSGVFDKNQIPFAAALTGLNKQANRPYPNVSGSLYYSGSFGSSNYHAISFKAEKRFSKGLVFLANYTISKNIENMGSGVPNFNQFATVIMLDSYSPQREKMIAPLDIPQVFVLSSSYLLPWGPGRKWLTKGVVGNIIGGWNISGITNLRGGFPAEVRVSLNPPNFTSWNITDRVSGVNQYLGNGVDGYLNPAAFRVPGTVLSQAGTPIQEYGNSGRGTIRGPGSVNFDIAALKDFRIGERIKVELRPEFFNATNTPTFFMGTPSSSAMTCSGTPGGPCTNKNFGTLQTGTATGRQIQFGMKFLF